MLLTGRHAIQRADPGQYDPFYSNIILLLKGEGTPNTNTITDDGPLALVPAATTATNSSTYFKYGSGSIRLMGTANGATSGITYASSSSWDFSLSWTLELWFNLPNGFNNASPQGYFSTGGSNRANFYVDSTNIGVYTGVGSIGAAHGGITANTWYHLAICKASGVNNPGFFLNGNIKSITAGSGTGWTSGNQAWSLGRPDGAVHSDLYIDELRYTKGVVRYTAPFVPVTYTFPKII